MKKIGRKVPFEELSEQERKLLRAAKKTMENAHCPYSGFHVGAAVSANGKVVPGANVENAAYPESCCAERTALFGANTLGCGDCCTAIAVVARSRDSPTTEITAPCGSCRQVIHEFAQRSGVDEEFKVIMATTNFDKIVITKIGDLLPLAFGPKNLIPEERKNENRIEIPSIS